MFLAQTESGTLLGLDHVFFSLSQPIPAPSSGRAQKKGIISPSIFISTQAQHFSITPRRDLRNLKIKTPHAGGPVAPKNRSPAQQEAYDRARYDKLGMPHHIIEKCRFTDGPLHPAFQSMIDSMRLEISRKDDGGVDKYPIGHTGSG